MQKPRHTGLTLFSQYISHHLRVRKQNKLKTYSTIWHLEIIDTSLVKYLDKKYFHVQNVWQYNDLLTLLYTICYRLLFDIVWLFDIKKPVSKFIQRSDHLSAF